MTDVAHPNVARLHEAFEAFGKGDLDRLQELWRPDIRWHEPGQNRLSGDYTGIDEVFELFGRVFVLSEGTFRVELQAAFADDTDGAAIVRITASRGDRHLDVLAADLVRFQDGQVAEFWEAHTDQAAMDAFFSWPADDEEAT
ncbi:nuclear transport factor 2 family protein [Geodermatophilus sp. SYSU D00684]